ncbi:hypothetical protein Gorai_004302, partial [Gossypium raimondii]|nr:hypothetical protein [Gossypium raimondii]
LSSDPATSNTLPWAQSSLGQVVLEATAAHIQGEDPSMATTSKTSVPRQLKSGSHRRPQEGADDVLNSKASGKLTYSSENSAKADENARKLADDLKELHNRIIQMEKELDGKRALELELQQLRKRLTVLKQVEASIKKLREMDIKLEEVEELFSYYLIRVNKSNNDLKDARKEQI